VLNQWQPAQLGTFMQMIQVIDKFFEVIIPESQIQDTVTKLAQQINHDYADKNPLFIPVLNGSFIFASDLIKNISINCQVTFVKVASYEATESKGEVEEILGLDMNVTGRHLIIVEDIVDTGLTMKEIIHNLLMFHPASIEVVTLLTKPEALKHPINLKYKGFELENNFVLGYGLDYNGYGRNLRDLYQLAAPPLKGQEKLNLL
jgi:hypoxanthine phosphoribosyltransferase